MHMMKPFKVVMVLAAVALLMPLAEAVPPAYEGPMGNPEEPALRVIKWPWLGLRKLVYHTHNGLKEGIQWSPIESIDEGVGGAVHGTGILVDHTARGMIYQKLPPKAPLKPGPSYECWAMRYIEMETNTGQPPQVQEVPAACPCCAAQLPPPEGGPYLAFKVDEPARFKVQRRYVGARTAQRDRNYASRKNLLKLAR
jgi:hypothetical protein